MQFERLDASHGERLLAFELENKDYFESYIAPREQHFYSPAGVKSHIDEVQHGGAESFVLLEGEAIIARANLRNIHADGSAEIGYRVAKNAANKGVGSACVGHLVSVAARLGIGSVYAFVINNNPASEKVLLNNGFHLELCLPAAFHHQGARHHGFKYRRTLEGAI